MYQKGTRVIVNSPDRGLINQMATIRLLLDDSPELYGVDLDSQNPNGVKYWIEYWAVDESEFEPINPQGNQESHTTHR